MSIQSIPIRARITFGDIEVVTPYILSFNVTKTRNNKSTFSASLKIKASELSSMHNNKVSISAGEKGDMKLIFTGFILSSRPSICFEDPNYVVLSISGSDILYLLEGEKYTRRQIDSKTTWGVIESVVRQAGKSSQLQVINTPVTVVDGSPISLEETRNKTNTTSDLSTFGTHNLPVGTFSVHFTYGPMTPAEIAQ